jgi:hypothetical protein
MFYDDDVADPPPRRCVCWPAHPAGEYRDELARPGWHEPVVTARTA